MLSMRYQGISERQIYMANAITGKEYPLVEIFSKHFEYHIPAYQRPYAWTKSETETLFDDLLDFYQSEKNDSYFLGSIVLIKEDDQAHADVIDGQQRLTTLTILFAALSDVFESQELKDECIDYLKGKGKKIEGTPPQPRLFLREKDQAFFNQYIQDVRINDLLKIDPKMFADEAQVHIQENCRILRDRLKDNFSDDTSMLGFIQFLVTRCFLIVVSTVNQESAFRIFSVMNSRGLDLLPTDIIKSETIGKLPAELQKRYTTKWEEMETLTGREGFNEVFTHTRTIFAKERSRKNLLDEFQEYVLSKTTPQSLIDDYLEPYTTAYIQLKNCEFSSTRNADEINGLLYWLNKTNNYDWMPPAIKFLAEHQNENDSDYILWFIKKLERLASYLLVTAQDVNHRMDRYKWLLVEMERRPDSSLTHPLVSIELTEWEKNQFRQALDGEIYTMTAQRRNYIIQRLDSFVSDGGASYNTKIFTIEHVLPQNPAADSEWTRIWPVEQQKHWLNRIGNLVPLTRQRNSAAQNYDFTTKKDKYFKSRNGTSSYTLTTQVSNEDVWTPEVVMERQEKLMQTFVSQWDLSSDDKALERSDFMIAGRGGDAVGYPLDGENFMVKKGSRISPDITDGLQQGYTSLRAQLISQGVIKDRLFTKDYQFDSPSAAAAVVLGRSANGRKEWTMLDGRSIVQAGAEYHRIREN